MSATRASTVLFSLLLAFTTLLGTTSGLPSAYDPSFFESSFDQSLCSLKSAKLPDCANQGSCLSPPPSGSKLVAVALGVGTQNYTCSSSTAAPTPNGAFAILYDISCTVATVPSAAHYLSALALKADVFTDYPIRSSMGYTTIGIHYFEPSTKSAVFEFDLNNKSYKFIGRRLENIPAPNQAAEGSVDWLKLGRTPGFERQSHNVKWVYRVLTAGGKAPNTCEGLPKEHTVNYATEYWFYN